MLALAADPPVSAERHLAVRSGERNAACWPTSGKIHQQRQRAHHPRKPSRGRKYALHRAGQEA